MNNNKEQKKKNKWGGKAIVKKNVLQVEPCGTLHLLLMVFFKTNCETQQMLLLIVVVSNSYSQ